MPSRFLPLCVLPLSAQTNAAAPTVSVGDNAWMLTSIAVVLLMTGSGLAIFYGGLVRRRNALGTMMHGFVLMAVVRVLWANYGYSLAFAKVTHSSAAQSTRLCAGSATSDDSITL